MLSMFFFLLDTLKLLNEKRIGKNDNPVDGKMSNDFIRKVS